MGGERAVLGEMGGVGPALDPCVWPEAGLLASPGTRGGSGCSTSWYRHTAACRILAFSIVGSE